MPLLQTLTAAQLTGNIPEAILDLSSERRLFMDVTADASSPPLPPHLDSKLMKSFALIPPNMGLPQGFALLRNHLGREALGCHGMLEVKREFW